MRCASPPPPSRALTLRHPASLDVPYNGRRKPLRKMLGEKATIVMNIKV